jgi:glutaminyl-tRNA synthetase
VDHSAPEAEIRLYDKLFLVENPQAEDDWLASLNPHSKTVCKGRVEPSLVDAWKTHEKPYQFQRSGYFCVDKDSTEGNLVFNRVVTLRESSSAKASKK